MDMVWRSVIRTGEVERRIQKCNQCHTELETYMSEGFYSEHPDALALCKTMQPRANVMTEIKDLCKDIRASTPESMAKEIGLGGEVSKLFMSAFPSMLNDRDQATVADMLSAIAKKLYTVPWNIDAAVVMVFFVSCAATSHYHHYRDSAPPPPPRRLTTD